MFKNSGSPLRIRKLGATVSFQAQKCAASKPFQTGLSSTATALTQRMLGNAVPSLLAEVLAREIRRQLLHDTTNFGPLKLIPAGTASGAGAREGEGFSGKVSGLYWTPCGPPRRRSFLRKE